MAMALRTKIRTTAPRKKTTAKPQTGALDLRTQPPARTTVPLNDTLIWYNRCRDLADQHQLTHAATSLGRSVRGIDIYSVPSTSQPGAVHLVRFHIVPRQVQCDCIAATYGRACGHAGAVLVAIERAEQAAAMQSEQWRWWMNTSSAETWDRW